MKLKKLNLFLCCLFTPGLLQAAANVNGETGYINMPSGRIEADGTFRMGSNFSDPYSNLLWSSITLLPRVELYARYIRVDGVAGGAGETWSGYGDYKDKVASGKFLLTNESWRMPSVAFGVNDVQGTGLFSAKYLAASKQFGALDTTLGYGTGRIDGWFAGARYAPEAWNGFAVAAEYDANDYPNDKFSQQTGLDQREKGLGLALEYRYGWLTSQLALRDGEPSLNAYASVPLQQREFIPKLHEPAPDTEVVARPSYQQWQQEPKYQQELVKRLLAQDFRNISLKVSEYQLEASLTNGRISLASRAVGRAARSLLLRAPQGVREIKIHYTVRDLPFATYTFFDVERLQRYFNGFISRKELAPFVSVQFADPQTFDNKDELLAALEAEYYKTYLDGNDGDMVSFRAEGGGLSRIRVAPGFGIYFNDPSGAFRYELFAGASMENHLGKGLFLNTTGQLMLHQNISGVTQASNSLLPHVRTDVAEYKKNGNIKLTQLTLSQYLQPEQRVYARVSAGLYEEMFGGFGGQVLYYPKYSPWAVDLTVDALRQRDVGGGLDFRDYQTVTALAGVHYRLPLEGVTASMRAGRFLAQDEGARFELKRRFRSGFEVGAWYTKTNGNDITNPGTPADPYSDKGVFMNIPLASMLTKDTPAAPRMSLSPWTRDVGQMVKSPGDLYQMLESSYANLKDQDGLAYFSDDDDSYSMSRNPTLIDRLQWDNWANDRSRTLTGLTSGSTWLTVGAGLGIAALASAGDKSTDKWAMNHQNQKVVDGVAKFGNALPLMVGGAAALMALDHSDQRLSATSFSALEAGTLGIVASELSKYAFGRARPEAGKGHKDFNSWRKNNGNSSFPSGHTTLAWALLTPYAKEYDAPWLYGLAALTNVGRIVDRKHWLSDTVAGALLGYTIGDALWRWHREDGPMVSLQDNGVKLTWETK